MKGGFYKQAEEIRYSIKFTMQTTGKPTVLSSIAICCEARSDRIPINTPPCLLHELFFSPSALYIPDFCLVLKNITSHV